MRQLCERLLDCGLPLLRAGDWRSLGGQTLRGVGEPIELFTAPEL